MDCRKMFNRMVEENKIHDRIMNEKIKKGNENLKNILGKIKLEMEKLSIFSNVNYDLIQTAPVSFENDKDGVSQCSKEENVLMPKEESKEEPKEEEKHGSPKKDKKESSYKSKKPKKPLLSVSQKEKLKIKLHAMLQKKQSFQQSVVSENNFTITAIKNSHKQQTTQLDTFQETLPITAVSNSSFPHNQNQIYKGVLRNRNKESLKKDTQSCKPKEKKGSFKQSSASQNSINVRQNTISGYSPVKNFTSIGSSEHKDEILNSNYRLPEEKSTLVNIDVDSQENLENNSEALNRDDYYKITPHLNESAANSSHKNIIEKALSYIGERNRDEYCNNMKFSSKSFNKNEIEVPSREREEEEKENDLYKMSLRKSKTPKKESMKLSKITEEYFKLKREHDILKKEVEYHKKQKKKELLEAKKNRLSNSTPDIYKIKTITKKITDPLLKKVKKPKKTDYEDYKIEEKFVMDKIAPYEETVELINEFNKRDTFGEMIDMIIKRSLKAAKNRQCSLCVKLLSEGKSTKSCPNHPSKGLIK